ncbi:MAG: amino-acid racemase [Acidimicrobiaceae bacterium]|nr:amino-acid racemase [Acidimicrobiaceae bacterium]
MRTIGLLGGMSWESTAVYYRLLNQVWAQRNGPWEQPEILLYSVNFRELESLQRTEQWDAAARMLVEGAERLERAGAALLGICANTMHIAAAEVAAGVPALEVVDVRKAVAAAAADRGLGAVALLGTRYTMERPFFVDELTAAGIGVVLPSPDDRAELQRIVYDELTQGIVTPESRAAMLRIIEDCVARGADGAALCCTEFGLLVDDRVTARPLIDSTTEHVRAILDAAA